jgi:pyruvate dehydrogenase E2 component (dihydrolipoamide acetyltransferase)
MDVLMPQLGETVAEGKITKWFKSAGDSVKPGDNLFEIETDKTSMEVPATSAGVLAEILVPEGEIAPVGAVVAVLSGDGMPATRPAAAAPAPTAPAPPAAAPPRATNGAPPAAATATAQQAFAPPKIDDPFREVRTPERNFGKARLPGGTLVTPLARRLAVESGIDLMQLSPSGPGGRIVARDVELAAIRSGRPAATPATPTATAERIKAQYQAGTFRETPLDGMRRTIAARLTEAKQTTPHFYLGIDVDVDRVMAVREDANKLLEASGEKISLNDFIIKALALALQKVPAANAVFAEDRILQFSSSDIGVAVSIDGGLVTPVIRDAQAKTISDIAQEMKDLAARARAKKLRPSEIQGGASAISNLGMYGVRTFSAIINPPHATILAVGTVQRRPIEDGESVRFANQMSVTLSCDHRVVDGALGAELLAAFKLYIEHPVGMMI